MKIVQINATYGTGSTGKICRSISELLTRRGIENYIIYSSGNLNSQLGIQVSSRFYIKLQAIKSKVFGNYGFNSRHATKRIIRILERIAPDIVHLHNIHGHDCNLELLFEYLKRKNLKIIWTFHDCWAFTGYCPHFAMVGCEKWKIECQACAVRKEYSLIRDGSRKLYKKKKALFAGLNLTIVTPSKWLADVTKESFLKKYPVRIINNGIDLEIFKPRNKENNKKYILLGVANEWNEKKGLDIFVELSKCLSEEKYQIVLVGTNEEIDKELPKNILSIHKTQNQEELADIYSAANVFVNPTREENFPTVNIEALACGTPVITFRTGGSPEILDESCGSIVECNDMKKLIEEIEHVCEEKKYSKDMCRSRAEQFDKDVKFEEYIELYMESMDE